MKKIMFNDKYGLTQAVLAGRKTMTRRLVGNRMTKDDIRAYFKGYTELANQAAKYNIGEIVAIAQSYKDAGIEPNESIGCRDYGQDIYSPIFAGESKGWSNKMFVSAELMPHHIRITDIKIERLQDISEEDCLKEGIIKREWENADGNLSSVDYVIPNFRKYYYNTAKDAFANLIDKTCGRGTWDNNPYVFVYEFEKIG